VVGSSSKARAVSCATRASDAGVFSRIRRLLEVRRRRWREPSASSEGTHIVRSKGSNITHRSKVAGGSEAEVQLVFVTEV